MDWLEIQIQVRLLIGHQENLEKGYGVWDMGHIPDKHKVETSKDGERWEVLYERECTGWEFKPMTVDREIKYFRVTISGVSEGRAGLGEISLY